VTDREVYAKYGAFINRYRGGMPAGFLAAIIAHESGGRENATGDPSLGELGLMQITANFPTTVGVTPAVRAHAEGNIFLGCLEYQIEAARLAVRYPGDIEPGSPDQWKMARLVFALGIGAVTKLVALVGSARFPVILSYVMAHPNVTVSGYAPGKVLARTTSVETLWTAGAQITPATVGVPELVPAPAGLTYTLPRNVRLPGPLRMGGAGLVLLGAALLFFWR
jgi:hypothetical protein